MLDARGRGGGGGLPRPKHNQGLAILKAIHRGEEGTAQTYGCGSKPMGSHFGVGSLPILVGILVGIGMFTGGTGF